MKDLESTRAFLATHARLLDRRRFALFTGDGDGGVDAAAALAALAAYGNPGGGYGNALEPDLRSATSQPVAALHAFEVFEEIAPETSPQAARLCDWLESITVPDGGLPFALPIPDPEGCAPFFLGADPAESNLHMTSMLAGIAHRVARHDGAVRDHPWLRTATAYAMRRIAAIDGPGHALEFRYALQFLDAVYETEPGAPDELRRLAAFIPASGTMPVAGGTEGEAMRPLDFAPVPDRPLRAHFPAEAIAAELDQLAADQHDDGGWDVDWTAFSPAGALEWRGWATVRALRLLKANARLP